MSIALVGVQLVCCAIQLGVASVESRFRVSIQDRKQVDVDIGIGISVQAAVVVSTGWGLPSFSVFLFQFVSPCDIGVKYWCCSRTVVSFCPYDAAIEITCKLKKFAYE